MVLSGTYNGKPTPGARMIAAIVGTPHGPWYFKLVGSAQVVRDWKDEFVKMVREAYH